MSGGIAARASRRTRPAAVPAPKAASFFSGGRCARPASSAAFMSACAKSGCMSGLPRVAASWAGVRGVRPMYAFTGATPTGSFPSSASIAFWTSPPARNLSSFTARFGDLSSAMKSSSGTPLFTSSAPISSAPSKSAAIFDSALACNLPISSKIFAIGALVAKASASGLTSISPASALALARSRRLKLLMPSKCCLTRSTASPESPRASAPRRNSACACAVFCASFLNSAVISSGVSALTFPVAMSVLSAPPCLFAR